MLVWTAANSLGRESQQHRFRCSFPRMQHGGIGSIPIIPNIQLSNSWQQLFHLSVCFTNIFMRGILMAVRACACRTRNTRGYR